MVICPQSKFFEKACSNFKEAETNLIELKFGEENLLEDMIEFLYKGDFDYAPDDVETSCICPKGCCKHGAVYYAHLYVMADFYDIPAMKELALKVFHRWLEVPDGGRPPDMDARIVAARIIYTQTPEIDRSLRWEVAKSLASLAEYLEQHTEYAVLISDVPEVALGVMRAQRLAAKQPR